jgi:stage III sporulation protein AG
MNKDKINNLISNIFSDKKTRFIVVAIICLILVVSIFMSFPSENNNKNESSDLITEYVNRLERKLSETLSKVEDVGSVSVVITVASGMQTVLATKTITTQTENGVETEETPLIINGKTVVLREDYPKITGVLIVAQGVNNFAVLSRIQQATMSLLNIELNQIEILSKK